MILLTGATGLLGHHLLKELLRKEERVRVLVRNPAAFQLTGHPQVEVVRGDVTVKESLPPAVAGVSAVIHSAAVVTFWKKRWQEMEEVNIGGTQNLLAACRASGQDLRFIHISSIASVGDAGGALRVTEDTPTNRTRFPSHYAASKCRAEQEVLKAAAEGLRAVILVPPGIVGTGWGKWGESSAAMFRVGHLGFPFASDSVMPIVGADDVAQAASLLLEHDAGGEKRFFLVSANPTQREFFSKIARALGKPPPRFRTPERLLTAAAWILERIADYTGREPAIAPEMTHLFSNLPSVAYDGSAITRHLPFRYASIDQVIQSTAESFLRDIGQR